MKDRRCYPRLYTALPATIYLPDYQFEITATIVNISEVGACFRIEKASNILPAAFPIFKAIFIDSFFFGSHLECDIPLITCHPKYTKEDDAYVYIGCEIRNDMFANYYVHKMVSRMETAQYEFKNTRVSSQSA